MTPPLRPESKRYTLTPPSLPAPKIPYTQELNAEQLQVVTSGEGPVLVLAGPGSGKTRTLIYRVAYLLEKGIDPQRILLVTFTVKAAREMLDRVERLLKVRPQGLWGGTFHHIGNLILRRHAEKVQRTPTFGILDEEDAKGLISTCVSDLKVAPTKTRFPQANVLESIFSLSVNTCRSLEQVASETTPQFLELLPLIQRVFDAYQERKRTANLLDYDDLLTCWLRMLQENPDLCRRYSEQFKYVLVDEYQDTNRLQFELIRTLSCAHKNLLVVGDDAQAIYAFRGAEIQNLLEFPQIFPGATIYRLQTNYRSTPEILRLANASIQFNSRQFPKELKSVKEPGPIPAVVPLVDAKQQAAFVAQRILELREEGIPLAQMAVLFRARFQAAELELEMAKRNIPYLVRGGVRFFEQAHIKDVLAYLRMIINPHDELAWERVLRLQEGIGAVYARQIWTSLKARSNPLAEAIQDRAGEGLPSRAGAGWKQLCRTLRELTSRSVANRPAEMVLTVLRGGYQEQLKNRFEDAKDRREDLEQLVNLAANYDSTERFIEDLTLREPFKGETLRGWAQADEALVLSTIHQAKGLEWTALFLIGLVEGQFPHPKSIEDPSELEEERRLFYVAVTRTQRELYLTYPLTRYSYQRGEVLMRPSIFLQELPENLCELWRVVGDDLPSVERDVDLLAE